MLNDIIEFNDLIDQFNSKVVNFIKDKSIDIEERWRVFTEWRYNEPAEFVIHLKSLHDDYVCYDGIYHIERHQIVDMVNMYNEIKNIINDQYDYIHKLTAKFIAQNPVNFTELKEEILQTGYRYYKYV